MTYYPPSFPGIIYQSCQFTIYFVRPTCESKCLYTHEGFFVGFIFFSFFFPVTYSLSCDCHCKLSFMETRVGRSGEVYFWGCLGRRVSWVWAWLTDSVLGQPGIHSDTLSQKNLKIIYSHCVKNPSRFSRTLGMHFLHVADCRSVFRAKSCQPSWPSDRY